MKLPQKMKGSSIFEAVLILFVLLVKVLEVVNYLSNFYKAGH